jgi:hypothetical protein
MIRFGFPMKYRPKYLVLIGTLMALAIVGIACGSGDEVASDPNPSTEVAAETSSIITNDTPSSGSTDGTFTVGEGSEATFTVNEQLSRLP